MNYRMGVAHEDPSAVPLAGGDDASTIRRDNTDDPSADGRVLPDVQYVVRRGIDHAQGTLCDRGGRDNDADKQ